MSIERGWSHVPGGIGGDCSLEQEPGEGLFVDADVCPGCLVDGHGPVAVRETPALEVAIANENFTLNECLGWGFPTSETSLDVSFGNIRRCQRNRIAFRKNRPSEGNRVERGKY